MNVRVVIQAHENDQDIRSQLWEGQIEIQRGGIYVAKISFMGEGGLHPIVDIPFSLDVGYWQWVPPGKRFVLEDKESLVERDEKRSYE